MPTFKPRTFGDYGNTFGPYFGLFVPDPLPAPFAPRTEVPFEIQVFDKGFKRVGWVGRYEQLAATVRHNAIGVASFDVLLTQPRMPDLMTPGARIVMNYDGDYLISGPVESNNVQEALGICTFTVQSDWAKLAQMLGWPNPSGAINNQGAATEYYTVTGPAETVVKTIVAANVARLGIPMVIAPDQGRGAVVTVMVRMHSLPDRMFPVIDQAGIGVDIRQSGQGWLLDCYVPTVRTRVLSQASGVVIDSSASLTNPTLTRVVVGGQGKGTAREFQMVINAPLEAKYGFVREGFVDARDVSDTAGLIARGQEALAAAAETYGFNLTLAENNAFKYGRTILRGDIATYSIGSTWLATPILVQDTCRQVTITHNRGEPVIATPSLGDPDAQNPDKVVMSAITRLDKQAKNKGTT